jgi:hypothetical protein
MYSINDNLKMDHKHLLLCGECQCKESFEYFIEQYTQFNKIYKNVSMLVVVFDKHNYQVNIDSLTNIYVLYIDLDKLKSQTVVRNMYNKHCNEELFGFVFNEILSELKKPIYQSIDNLIYMSSLSQKSALPMNKIIQITNKHSNFDIVFSNDLSNSIFYYAYRCEKNPIGIEILGQHWESELKTQIQKTIQTSSEEYMPILSGYSSITLFNMNTLRNFDLNCSCIPSYDVDYYYRSICNDIILSTQETINHTLMGMYLFENSPVFYRFHHALNYPIVHPFVNLCFTLQKNKQKATNIYVCKTLTL